MSVNTLNILTRAVHWTLRCKLTAFSRILYFLVSRFVDLVVNTSAS